MTDIQIEIFWCEVDLIQKRHALFFPALQKQYIELRKCELIFLEGYACPEVITLEIEMVFKIVWGCALWL